MRHVGVGHDPVVVAHAGDAPVLRVPRLNVHVLADGVAVADLQARGLALVLLVLWLAPMEQKWKMRLSRPILVWPVITQCAPTVGAVADPHMRVDDRVRRRR